MLIQALPGSGPLERVETLWRPSLQYIRRGSESLSKGDTAAADAWFEIARSAGRPRERQDILRLIAEACCSSESWVSREKYARQVIEGPHTPLDDVRYGEALIALGQAARSEPWFVRALSELTLPPFIPPLVRGDKGGSLRFRPATMNDDGELTYDLAEGDLAFALASQKKDLERAQKLAEDGIRRQTRCGGPREMRAMLHDTLAWVYYQKGAATGTYRDLELARIYGETAMDHLAAGTNSSVAAAVFFHLSKIYGAEGMKDASARAHARSRRANAVVARWLEGH